MWKYGLSQAINSEGYILTFYMVGIAQLVRAPGCGPGGRRFESDYPPHFSTPPIFGGIAQLARASGSYPAGRWFKSDFRYQK